MSSGICPRAAPGAVPWARLLWSGAIDARPRHRTVPLLIAALIGAVVSLNAALLAVLLLR